MAITASKKAKPVWDFATQVVVGAFLFMVVMLVAVALAGMVKWMESLGFVPLWLINGAHWMEWGVFWVDAFCFALFLLSEAIKLMRGLWGEWRNYDGHQGAL